MGQDCDRRSACHAFRFDELPAQCWLHTEDRDERGCRAYDLEPLRNPAAGECAAARVVDRHGFERARVVGVEGLYAAGADAGGIAAGGYASGLAGALVTGRIAAEAALAG